MKVVNMKERIKRSNAYQTEIAEVTAREKR